MSRKKISTTVYITPEQDAALKQLNSKTKVPVAEYIRQGIELVLEEASIDTLETWPQTHLLGSFGQEGSTSNFGISRIFG